MDNRAASLMKAKFARFFCLIAVAGFFAAYNTPTPHASRTQVPPPPRKPAPIPESFASEPAPLPPIVETSLPEPEPAPTSTPTPAVQAPVENNLVVISTKFGDIVLELNPDAAPKTVENFKKLVGEGYYNGTTFHRVIPGFMIQGGDPNSKDPDRSLHGQGGPGYTIPPEIKLKHVRGSVATARLGDSVNPKRESSGSQFFICVANAPYLDGQYTVFAKVVSGMDVADKIVAVPRDGADNPVESIPMKVTFKKVEN